LTSEEELETIKRKITQWLSDEGYTISEHDEDNPGNINKFVLRVDRNGMTLLHIVKPKSSRDRFVVGRGIALEKMLQIAYSQLQEEVRRKFVHELRMGLGLMKVFAGFDSPKPEQNIKIIRLMKVIYSDGLSKDRLFESMSEVLLAYGFVTEKFRDFNISSEPFDPNLYI